ALTEIYSPMATPPAAEGAFGGSTRKDTPVYVPKGSKEAYETAPGWDYFTTFIEIDNTPGESGVDSPEGDDGIRVYAEGGRLRIEGAPQGTRYKVYTPDGRMVSAGDAAAPAALPSGAIYIVRVDGMSYKVKI
ncbi:MAG: hypothetical protein J1E29_04570, partial [Duncaniella sp.]|nr:hypothetical protein [Duncaniella sp.]